MIKFRCENCGKNFSAPDEYAGKKGKCPGCKRIIIIPDIEKSRSAEIQNSNAGQLPDIQNLPTLEQLVKKEPPRESRSFQLPLNERPGENISPEDQPARRTLPWVLDIFLYPVCVSGIVHFVIFCLLFVVIWLVFLFAFYVFYLFWFAVFGLSVIFAGYVYYYFIQCVRDSADGGIRAPDNVDSISRGEDFNSLVSHFFISIFVLWGPLLGYCFYQLLRSRIRFNTYDPQTDVIFWMLFSYAIFFFPIVLLAAAKFDSLTAFNPILWIRSIGANVLRYVALVAFFFLLGWIFLITLDSFEVSFLHTLIRGAVFIYLAMVGSHLLGRFYYLRADQLSWDV